MGFIDGKVNRDVVKVFSLFVEIILLWNEVWISEVISFMLCCSCKMDVCRGVIEFGYRVNFSVSRFLNWWCDCC